jgi:hypothetical protein
MAALCWALFQTQDQSASATGIGTGRPIPFGTQSRRSPWTGFPSAAETWLIVATLLQSAVNFFDFSNRGSHWQKLAAVKSDKAIGVEEALGSELPLENALSV